MALDAKQILLLVFTVASVTICVEIIMMMRRRIASKPKVVYLDRFVFVSAFILFLIGLFVGRHGVIQKAICWGYPGIALGSILNARKSQKNSLPDINDQVP
ncbi:MAG: hypothetical protein KDC35_19335 [Acidobacteria bacterium]|nr:hypothetical protein [Acidobacteriota bacterium]